MIELISNSSDETIEIGRKLGSLLKSGDVIAYKGTLAAGKTTLTKGIAKSLGIEEDVTSPTFTLLSEYEGKIPLYHFDAYRLDDAQAFYDIGAEEFIYGDGVCAIEWTENVESAIPSDAIKIQIEIIEPEKRKITIENWPYEDIFGDYKK
ncbi:MAG: tRNA (adenosine(37)-N6)-threonylcarbamoyltransferase complex ATPase subunit type 1 TsaE [Treponemataceae bacterium]|nr:tRNA (adenosine(37)-N6)-threonylcarbamoyltransferase complex ATPase subunit type 1 TsaE [Treponemataceae bacterium]